MFVTCETPYRKPLIPFLEVYRARTASGDPWPGCVENVHDYVPRNANLPAFMNFLDDVVLARVFREAGFANINAFLFARPYLPSEVQLDGREGVGLIAEKPRS